MQQVYDIAIIGGGINGCGCAADASSRGLSVFLCEQDDLAAHTSSRSTKLIHGGLRYLEQRDFSLVKHALEEREVLMQSVPYLVRPLPLFLPYKKNMRPQWFIRLGLFIYDHLSRKNSLPKSKWLKRLKDPVYFKSLQDTFDRGFLFYDCTADDARLTLVNALSAKNNGAKICTRTRLLKAEVQDNQWILTMHTANQTQFSIRAKAVINAAGPWAEGVNHLLNVSNTKSLSLIKGSHLVVHKLYEGNHAYFLQHSDQRIVFVIPYYNHTMIGTTDVPYSGDRSPIHIDPNEIDYLLNIVNQYFKKQVKPHEIIHSWSGLRPLIAAPGRSPQALSRDYTWQFFTNPAPTVTIYGGKITTYRQLSKKIVDTLRPIFPDMGESVTDKIHLPGANYKGKSFADYSYWAKEKYHWLAEDTLNRYLSLYGTRAELILKDARQISDLGTHFGCTLYQAEVDYLIQEEWAKTSEDILWRRTKLGFDVKKATKSALENYMSSI